MYRLIAAASALFALVILQPAHSRELPLVEPEAAGMSSDKLALVAPAMKKFVDAQKVAGAITMVSRNGKIVLVEAIGKADVDSGMPMKPDTIARIYSMTKPITSVAIMMLVEEGKIGLDDPVAKHLPELKDVKVFSGVNDGELQLENPKRHVTIRDLLRHTSGLTYGIFGDTAVDQRYRRANVLNAAGTLEDMVTKLGKLPLLYQPGSRFNYSVSSDVLGRVVEVVSGDRLDQFFRERIFKPLGMKDTGFSVPDDKLDRFAANHSPKPSGGLRVTDSPKSSRYRQPPSMLSGGGGLVSTARDYTRFCQMLLNKGELDGTRLLRAETITEMTTNQLPEAAYPINFGAKRDGVGFGLGFSVTVEKTEYTRRAHLGEYAWGGAASTHFWISPKDDLAVVVLTQLMPFTAQMEHALKPLVYDAIKSATVPTSSFANYPQPASAYLERLHAKERGKLSFRRDYPGGFDAWQRDARKTLVKLLGLDRMKQTVGGHTPVVRLADSTHEQGYDRRRGEIETEPGVTIPFWLLTPSGTTTNARPLAICAHGHDADGWNTYAGVYRDDDHRSTTLAKDGDIGVQAVRRGFVTLVPATRGLASAVSIPDLKGRHGRRNCRAQLVHCLLAGRTAVGERVWDTQRLLDWALDELPNIDAKKVLVTGNSGGGVLTVYVAALDERVAVAVPSCSFTSYTSTNGYVFHCDCCLVPRIQVELGDMADVGGLTAPRPLLAVNGRKDRLHSYPDVESAVSRVGAIYANAKSPHEFQHQWGADGHKFYPNIMWPFIESKLMLDQSSR